MKEIVGDIWEGDSEVTCVTTNGVVKSNGMAVMGKGTALQAVERYPNCQFTLGWCLIRFGNVPHIINTSPYIVSFPVKYNWRDDADIGLIYKSAMKLEFMANLFNWTSIALPRPGCGNGGLKWEEVKSILTPLFDDRFWVYSEQ